MYEIKTEKVVKLNVGKDPITMDNITYDVQNALITGVTGSGVQKILDNIIMNLTLDYSPEEVGIQYLSYGGFNSPWVNPNRKLPHMMNQTYSEVGKTNAPVEFYENVVKCISACNELLNPNIDMVLDEDFKVVDLCKRKDIIILSIESGITDGIEDAVFALAGLTYTNNLGVNVIIVSHVQNEFTEKLAQVTSLHVVTRVNEEFSNKLLDCNVSARNNASHGFAWVKDYNNPFVLRCVGVPFKPDTLYGKIGKFLSNNNTYRDNIYSIGLGIANTDLSAAMVAYCTSDYDFAKKYYEDTDGFRTQYDKMCIYAKMNIFVQLVLTRNKLVK